MGRRFENRVAVVTGAGGVLGRALATAFAREGAVLALMDLPGGDHADLAGTVAAVEAAGSTATTYWADLSDEGAIEAAGAAILADHPVIHALCNNAGMHHGSINRPVDQVKQADWLRYFAVNTVAPLLLAQALRPALAAGKGAIVNQSSMAGFAPGNPYGITKQALNSMTYGMAAAYGADGVRVNAVAPGLIDTPVNSEALPAETRERIIGMQFLKGAGTMEDIAALTLFLCSDAAGFITAEVVSCDGGNRIRGWRV